MTVAIQVENVHFSYEDSPVLENVSFSIKEGDFIGVIGPNGGGKTTLLNLLLGFLHPQAGNIALFNNSPENFRKKIGYVPQFFQQEKNFPITVMEVVLLGGISQIVWGIFYPSSLKKRAQALLDLFEIGHLSQKTFGSLSGGQMQRVLIARALLCDPKILILDEPTANIDVQAKKIIFSTLSSWKKKKTILLVSHDFNTLFFKETDAILSVQKTVSLLKPEEICEHFALGLYHEPLLNQKPHHLGPLS